LPSSPKIFHGRETELKAIIKMLSQEAPRITILGAGGMGKTSLARAVLHHPDTLTRFKDRFFVSAEMATTSVELAALIGLHIGLNPGQDLTKTVVQYFARHSSCLLILDNLETVWEPIWCRSGVEEFLSLLSDVQHLALIITMRGAERPAKVRWTHPFLLPLQPLSDDAAQQTFIDITDNSHSIEDFNKLLSFTDNMPLAVDLLAHLVDFEGLENVLSRWETEKTSMLSVGYDRKSNLDASINLSLWSPRITSDSKELLSLLSILPNGLSDAELVQSKIPILNILSCKATLLATSLAYLNSNKRLLVLVPVREHIQQFLPPSSHLVHSLRKYFYELLQPFKGGQKVHAVVSQISSNLGNLQEVLQRGLNAGDPNLADTIYCGIYLSTFYRLTGRGRAP
ncbi:P-loop containing nucleoside triphosphate hydrolase protein, partial [Mycena sanguinolenta]